MLLECCGEVLVRLWAVVGSLPFFVGRFWRGLGGCSGCLSGFRPLLSGGCGLFVEFSHRSGKVLKFCGMVFGGRDVGGFG